MTTWSLRGQSRALGLSLLLLAVLTPVDLVAQDDGPAYSRSEFEARAAAFEFLLENYVSRHPKGDASDFCIVTGRRSYVALQHQDRTDEDWEPIDPFLERLTGKGVGVHPISECRWDGDMAEMVISSGAPAVSVALSPIVWRTALSGTVHMRVQENDFHTYGLECMVSDREGFFRIFNCVDRSPNPSFVGTR